MTTFQNPELHLKDLGKTVPTAAKRGLHMLQSLQIGGLHLTLPDGQRLRFGNASLYEGFNSATGVCACA